jgi:hypothetical protein
MKSFMNDLLGAVVVAGLIMTPVALHFSGII